MTPLGMAVTLLVMGVTPLGMAKGEAVKKLLQEVRVLGPNPNICLQSPRVPTPNSRIANTPLINLWRAMS